MKAVLTLLLFLCCLPFNSVTAQSTVSQFRSLDDVFDFVRPSKTFSTRGGDLEIRCVGRGEGESMLMYYRNKFLSEVGWENPNTAAKGSYARLAVRTDRYQVTVILHLPDGKHSKPYLYFEPLPTSTNRQLATALNRGARINMPISNGWLKFDPIVDGDYATLSFQPSSSEPTPYYYDMKEGRTTRTPQSSSSHGSQASPNPSIGISHSEALAETDERMMAQTKFHDVEAQEATGPVKSIVSSIMGNEQTVTFTPEGKMEEGQFTDMVYDENGYLQSAKVEMQGMKLDVKFTWKNGKVAGNTVNMMGQEMTATVAYNDKGAPMSETINVAGQFLVTAYSDYQYDDHGNWISRKATIQGQIMDQARTITYYE